MRVEFILWLRPFFEVCLPRIPPCNRCCSSGACIPILSSSSSYHSVHRAEMARDGRIGPFLIEARLEPELPISTIVIMRIGLQIITPRSSPQQQRQRLQRQQCSDGGRCSRRLIISIVRSERLDLDQHLCSKMPPSPYFRRPRGTMPEAPRPTMRGYLPGSSAMPYMPTYQRSWTGVHVDHDGHGPSNSLSPPPCHAPRWPQDGPKMARLWR